jgi:superfamily II DNA or RNA helicase/HKD family nuclease
MGFDERLPDGLYDLLATNRVRNLASSAAFSETAAIEDQRLAELLADVLAESLPKAIAMREPHEKIAFVNSLLQLVNVDEEIESAEILTAVRNSALADSRKTSAIPAIPLSDLALLTNAKGEPNMRSQLQRELQSADRVDILMAFVMKQGVALISEQLSMLRDRGVPVRLLTGVYRGATDKDAVDLLVRDFGVEVKINYETHSNHLHAKAWLIHRESGFSTAFVGSSNLSKSAFIDGMEWNVRLSARRSPHILGKFETEFNSHWENESYRAYDPETNGSEFELALSQANGSRGTSTSFQFNFLDVQPRLHQQKMLDSLLAEREIHGQHKNLVVAATGTGKTLLAAFDFKRLRDARGGKFNLLFVAHREQILRQSKHAFSAVLKDASFGQLLVGGEKPDSWNHVFASVQSLSSKGITELPSDQFDMIVIDEFHHADAPTYRKIIEHFKPSELLGLTATPERSDGKRVQDEFFDGRIAAEIRLWEALDLQLLTPFNYFGIGDETDYSQLNWSRGGYDKPQLSNLLTGNDARDRLVLGELQRKVSNIDKMRALVFCVSVEHARHIAEIFQKAGISCGLVLGETKEPDRQSTISRLQSGEIQAVVTVDVFNEGVDIPSVDTLVMLRPTESPVVFLQQLGRGLRLCEGKDVVNVFDFVGVHRAEYRADIRLEAMTGVSRGRLPKAIEEGFPLLPSGISITLDRMSREHILRNIKDQVRPSKSILVSEIQKFSALLKPEPLRLGRFLELSGRSLGELYKQGSWSELKRDAGLIPANEIGSVEAQLLSRMKRFLHVDDPERVAAYSSIASGSHKSWAKCNELEKRTLSMFFWLVWPDAKDSGGNLIKSHDGGQEIWRSVKHASAEMIELLSLNDEINRTPIRRVRASKSDLPLLVAKQYAREELLGAIQWASLAGESVTDEKSSRAARGMVAGVCDVPEIDLDCFFVTLQKVESVFSASTRYRDYAESREVFHWESQNKDDASTVQGKRYINQTDSKSDVLIAIREFSDDEFGNTVPFTVAGLADFERFEGAKPMKIWWRLRDPLGPDLYRIASAVRVA